MARNKKSSKGSAPQAPAEEPAGVPRDEAEPIKAPLDDRGKNPKTGPNQNFPIVAIGASAGGLRAIEEFFSALPAENESGMALVLVQHLSPDHKSMLVDLVRRYTRMQVYLVEDGMPIQPNCTYIIPPNRDMAVLNGSLHLLEPTSPRGRRLPIDYFFRSLALDQHERAICIVLSGTGSDGTLGLRAVKSEGGMAMAQNPESSEYDGMPGNAIATGLVDYILTPAEMPAQLIAYTSKTLGRRPGQVALPGSGAADALKKICLLLRSQTGHDFSQYKESTIVRRVERRMAIHQIDRPDDYLRFMQDSSGEAEALFRELLIGVTSLFRDPEAFHSLQSRAIPKLFAGKPAGGLIRAWVCGCSTGEEAYSVAILIQEHMDTLKLPFKVQIFATDIDELAIDQARNGVYPSSIAADLAPERLTRFFTLEPKAGAYHIHKHVRDLMIFSEQDVTRDPPFSRLDLICCRNLLIYMNQDLQKRLIPLFHYALNPGGILFLGSAESVGEFTTLFEVLDRKASLYLRKKDLPDAPRPLLRDFVPSSWRAGTPLQSLHPGGQGEPRPTYRELTEQSLLAHYAHAGVLVTGRGEILHIFGRTGKYLEPAPGDAGVNILPMAREGLRRVLTTALHQAATRREPVHCSGLQVKTNGDSVTVNLTVRPVGETAGADAASETFLVIMEEVAPPSPGSVEKAATSPLHPTMDQDERITSLERELRAKEEYLQSTLEEMETSNEELKSTNEEMQSVNEELQSTNEELETSKEELQSVNEELATVNSELQTKVADLTRANNDMNNLLAGTGVGTLFLDQQMRIARFTPDATHAINLIPSDIGRPVGHIATNLVHYDRLVADVQSVLDRLIPFEAEVQTRSTAWYIMRIRPYRTLENVVEGVVITFVDITVRKRAEEALRQSERKFALAFHASPDVLLISRCSDGKILQVNENWERMFGHSQREVIGRSSLELGCFVNPDDRQLAMTLVRESGGLHNHEVRLRRKSGEVFGAMLSIDPLEIDGEAFVLKNIRELPQRGTGNGSAGDDRDRADVTRDSTVDRNPESPT